jgi:hypothetical protein
MLKFFAKNAWYFVLLAAGLILISAIFHQGWYAAHDGIFHIYRTEEALNMLKLKQFPLRWAGNFDQGFGIPLFTFIYPLPYYITSIISFFTSSIWAVKILTVLAYLSGGLGIFQLFRKSGHPFAFFMALIYLMTPYQFLNIFVRGALGEILALGLMPWVLYSFSSLVAGNAKLKWYHPIPLGLLLIAHNFLGILFAVFIIGYVLFQQNRKSRAFASLLLSFGLAAFFLIPMVVQKNLLYSTEHPDLNFRFDQHFVTFKQLLYSKWDYWYSLPGDQDGMSFQLGITQLALALGGVVYTILKKNRTKLELYLIVAYFGSLFLMHARSYPIWNAVPILKSIQFPWRFLFMPAILTPLLAAPFLLSFSKKKFFPYLLLIILAVNFVNVRNYRRPIKYFDLTEYTDLYRLYYNKSSTTFRTEILPKWSVPNERYKTEELLVNSGNMTIDSLTHNPLSVVATINNKPDESEGRVTILRNYYPGWVARMDGKKTIALTPTAEGMIYLRPELGVHTYEIRIKNTPLERVSNIISFASLLGLGYLWLKNRKPNN